MRKRSDTSLPNVLIGFEWRALKLFRPLVPEAKIERDRNQLDPKRTKNDMCFLGSSRGPCWLCSAVVLAQNQHSGSRELATGKKPLLRRGRNTAAERRDHPRNS